MRSILTLDRECLPYESLEDMQDNGAAGQCGRRRNISRRFHVLDTSVAFCKEVEELRKVSRKLPMTLCIHVRIIGLKERRGRTVVAFLLPACGQALFRSSRERQ